MLERRTATRLLASIPVDVVHGQERRRHRLVDVSDDGLFFACWDGYAPGAMVKLEFDAAGQKAVAIGFVVRRGERRGVPGVAVQFFAQSQRMTNIWRRFIVELRKLYQERSMPLRLVA